MSLQETTYAPVIDALEDAGVDCRNPGLSQGLIVHTFSNGESSQSDRASSHCAPLAGGCSLLLLLSRLMQRRAPQPPLNDVARTLLVFDSGPGRGDFVKVHRGATATMNLATNALFTFFFFAPAFAIVQLYCLLMHQPDPIEGYRRDLARPDVFPWTRDTTPRLFLYGAQDNIVPRKDVEDHVADLRALGLATQLEMFATSGHIGHAKSEPLRYWGVVRDAWDEACDKAPRRRPVRITSRL